MGCAELLAAARAGSPALDTGAAVAIPLFLTATYTVLRKRSASVNEAVQAVFAMAASAFAALTVNGVFFRGEGMRWVLWP
jgi:hypothetical protein